jgi:hypothetical protein
MSLSLSRSLIIAIVLVGIGIGIAVLFVAQRMEEMQLDKFYVVSDSLVDYSASQHSHVYFVQVTEYDTLRMARVANHLALTRVVGSHVPAQPIKDLLVFFYEPTDTSALTADEVDDLAYTNREQADPGKSLYAVRNGFQLRARFEANSNSPTTDVSLVSSTFFRPRAGIRAADLRGY